MHTLNKKLRNLVVSIEDHSVHSRNATSAVTKIYTLPNMEVADMTSIMSFCPFNTRGTKGQVSAHTFAMFFVCGMVGRFRYEMERF